MSKPITTALLRTVREKLREGARRQKSAHFFTFMMTLEGDDMPMWERAQYGAYYAEHFIPLKPNEESRGIFKFIRFPKTPAFRPVL